MTPDDEKQLRAMLQGEPRDAIVALAQLLYDKAKSDFAAGKATTRREVAILNDARRVLHRERDHQLQE